MLMIRLARRGARKQPHYRIVVIEKERARNGRPVEVVGTYNPRTNPASVELKRDPCRVLGVEGRANVGAGEQVVHQDSGSRPRWHRRLIAPIDLGCDSDQGMPSGVPRLYRLSAVLQAAENGPLLSNREGHEFYYSCAIESLK